jgi:lipopolysaccharide export LptBFGC system permease protein LptF
MDRLFGLIFWHSRWRSDVLSSVGQAVLLFVFWGLLESSFKAIFNPKTPVFYAILTPEMPFLFKVRRKLGKPLYF